MGIARERRLTIGELFALVQQSGLRSPSESAAMIRADRDDPTRGVASTEAVALARSKAASRRCTPKGNGVTPANSICRL